MGISVEQKRFLSERLQCNSDKAAAEKANVKPDAVYHWKVDNPKFKELYDGLAEDGVKLCMEILRESLGKAAEVVTDAMQAKDHRGKPDHIARMNAAKLAMQAHGVIKTRQVVEGDPEHPVETVIRIERSDSDKNGKATE